MKKFRIITISFLLAGVATLWLLLETGVFYPGGAIHFTGMDKRQIIEELDSLRIPYGDHGGPRIYLTVRSTGKYYETVDQALADPFIMTEDVWLVNPRSRLWAMFEQKLEFGTDGRVQRQSAVVSRDGP